MKISDVYGSLVATWIEWQKAKFLINKRFVRKDNVISWEEFTPTMLDDLMEQKNIIDLIDKGQYSFQINVDESIVQLHYVYDREGNLSAANLAYYSLNLDSDAPVGWLRIDYDPSSFRRALHPLCHMHISLFPNMRFPVDGVPSPKQFIDFIALVCYPDVYQSMHIGEDGNFSDINRMLSANSPFFHLDDPESYKVLTHIRIPTFE